ncbi:olfactory receptor 5V1-like [Pyxicephalus adspersus]|uniref:Olfactory receptor n=1 Tax=Pyxicephalus adspersus TaxID=30357 RepID=A0AAV2ZGZ3_PYXAD|nr:TPA: hypothetical protein GDO54_005068 [Pyxicephalus adspersus]
MENRNQTYLKAFFLLRLSDIPVLQIFFFLIFLLMYIMTLSGNVLLIIVVRCNTRLQTPMYFFLSNLSIVDICFSSTVVPKLLVNIITQETSISFLGCAAQLYFHLSLGVTECLILAVMAFDRYVAICKPLRYSMIMSKTMCVGLSLASWTIGFGSTIIHTVFTFQLPFCKSNFINHFFCEVPPLLRLSCRDVWLNEVAEYLAAAVFALGTFLLILFSFLCITLAMFRIRSTRKRLKMFSTCTSHIAVSLYYGAIMFMHLRPRNSYSPEQDKTFSIIYTVVTPMLNPIIIIIINKQDLYSANILRSAVH